MIEQFLRVSRLVVRERDPGAELKGLTGILWYNRGLPFSFAVRSSIRGLSKRPSVRFDTLTLTSDSHEGDGDVGGGGGGGGEEPEPIIPRGVLVELSPRAGATFVIYIAV